MPPTAAARDVASRSAPSRSIGRPFNVDVGVWDGLPQSSTKAAPTWRPPPASGAPRLKRRRYDWLDEEYDRGKLKKVKKMKDGAW